MQRRKFFKNMAGSVIAVGSAGTILNSCSGNTKQNQENGNSFSIEDEFAGYKLNDLKNKYHSDLFDEFLPFMDKYIIDHELGGFLCNTDRDGTHVNTNKRTWYEGRGIWLYSYLYNHFGQDPVFLETAKKSVDFILKTKPAGDRLWTPWFTRDGKPIGGEDTELYSDLHVAQGLTQYATASGDMSYLSLAKEILLKCIDIYDNRPGYGTDAHFYQVQINEKKRYEGVEQPRIIGHWMDFMTLTTQMLEAKEDDELEAFSNRITDAVLNHHFNTEFGLITEYLNHDLSPIKGAQGREVTGHVPETLWMILYEAVRKKDRKTFDIAALHLHRHIEVLYDYVYEGAFHGLLDVETHKFDMTKALWVQDEMLVGCMYVYEHTGAEWAKEWYVRIYNFIQKKASLKQYGFPLWNIYADRKMTFVRHYDRIDTYHHPRELILNLKSIERLIKNDGALSNPF